MKTMERKNSEVLKNEELFCLNSSPKKNLPMEFSKRTSCIAIKNHCEKIINNVHVDVNEIIEKVKRDLEELEKEFNQI